MGADDMDGGKFALIWWSPKDELFYVATKQSDTESSYVIYTTDGVAERVYVDQNQDSSYNVTETAATARFDQFSNTLYMSIDVACETQTNNIEPCLEKGDLIFITDANWGQDLNTQQNKAFFGADTVVDFAAGYADTTDLYTITKIWTAEETADTAVMCTAAKSSEWSCTVQYRIVGQPPAPGAWLTPWMLLIPECCKTTSANATPVLSLNSATTWVHPGACFRHQPQPSEAMKRMKTVLPASTCCLT